MAHTQSETGSHFDRQSWLVLLLALLIVAFGLFQSFYWLSLPSDGWTNEFDPNEANPYYVFRQYVGGAPSPIQEGDVLVAVEDQPVTTIVQRARAVRPQPPISWVAGGIVRYMVLRKGQMMTLAVPLEQRAPTLLVGALNPMANVLSLLLILPIWLLGLTVFFLRPRLVAARLLLLFSAFFFVGTLPLGGWNYLSVMLDRPAMLMYSLFNAWGMGLIPLMVHLMLVFPEVKKPIRQHPWLVPAVIYSSSPALVWLSTWLNYRYALNTAFDSLVFLGAFVTLIVTVSHSMLTLRDPVTRAQMRWVSFGVVAGFMGGVAIYFLSLLFSDNDYLIVLQYLTIPVFPICLAVAILRYRLFDIDILIRRTLVYAVLTAVLALFYFGSVVLLQAILRTLTGQGQSQIVTVLSTLAIAALFTPLRRQVQRVIDRQFYRSQYNAAQTLAAFAATTRDEVDLNRMTAELIHMVEATMRPAHVSLWLKNAPQRNISTSGDEHLHS